MRKLGTFYVKRKNQKWIKLFSVYKNFQNVRLKFICEAPLEYGSPEKEKIELLKKKLLALTLSKVA